MKYQIAPLSCRPWTLNGITPRLIESHYENDYGSALVRLNQVAAELEALDPATTPAHVVSRLKRDEAALLNSTLLHELYFSSVGSDGRAVPEEMAAVISRDFGSVLRWRQEFTALAESLAGGSGWVLLTYVPRDGRLTNHSATDYHQSIAGGIPIRAIDMYEHAYHLDFGERDCLHRCVHAQHRLGHGADTLPQRSQGRTTTEARAETVARPAGNECGRGQGDAGRGPDDPDHRYAPAALHHAPSGAIRSVSMSGSANCRRPISWSHSASTVSTSAARRRRRCARRASTRATWPVATMPGRQQGEP